MTLSTSTGKSFVTTSDAVNKYNISSEIAEKLDIEDGSSTKSIFDKDGNETGKENVADGRIYNTSVLSGYIEKSQDEGLSDANKTVNDTINSYYTTATKKEYGQYEHDGTKTVVGKQFMVTDEQVKSLGKDGDNWVVELNNGTTVTVKAEERKADGKAEIMVGGKKVKVDVADYAEINGVLTDGRDNEGNTVNSYNGRNANNKIGEHKTEEGEHEEFYAYDFKATRTRLENFGDDAVTITSGIENNETDDEIVIDGSNNVTVSDAGDGTWGEGYDYGRKSGKTDRIRSAGKGGQVYFADGVTKDQFAYVNSSLLKYLKK